jgi:hypothetical protein
MPTTLPTVTGPDMAKGYGQIFEAIATSVSDVSRHHKCVGGASATLDPRHASEWIRLPVAA